MTALAVRLGFNGTHDYPARVVFGFVVLVGIAAVAFIALGAAYASHDTRTTRTVKVERSWGTPDQTIPAAEVAGDLATSGLTCDWYASKHTLVCHP